MKCDDYVSDVKFLSFWNLNNIVKRQYKYSIIIN